MTFDIGAGTGLLVDGRDVTEKSNTLQVDDSADAVEDTRFHPSRRSRSYIDGLNSGAITFAGYLPVEAPLAIDEMQTVIGAKRDPHLIAGAPFGFGAGVGNLVCFGQSLQNQWGVDAQRDGVVSCSASFQVSEGIKDGVVLNTPHSAGVASVQEVQTIAVVVADAPVTVTVADAASNTTTFARGANAATVQTALEKLPRVGRGSVTVVLNSAAGTDTYTLTFSAHLGNVGQITSPSAGVTTATTTQGRLPNLNIVTATGNGTGVDNTSATASGWTAQLNVIHVAGTTPTLDVVIEHSTDNVTYTTLGTFTQVTATGSQSLSSASKTTAVNRYVRAKRTIGGTLPKFAYSVSFARRK